VRQGISYFEVKTETTSLRIQGAQENIWTEGLWPEQFSTLRK